MKKITTLFLLMFAVLILQAQSSFTVSSPDDDGAGTLRNLISTVASGDIINIPSGYIITLQSPLTIAKQITINGQGTTIKTTEPGVSAYRLFVLGNASGSTNLNIAFNDIKFKGGDVRLNSDVTATAPSYGGSMLILKRVNLTLNNCEFTDSKAVRGGAICVIDGQGFSSHIENCKFSGNNASEYAGALYFNRSQNVDNVAGVSVVINTVFEGNISALASAVKINVPSQFKNCLFKENHAPIATTTAAGSGAFVVDDNPNSNVRLESCTFFGNNSGGTDPTKNNDGGSAFIANSLSTTFFFTNCTFYGNIGSRATIYLRYGKIFFVNNTVAGNIGYGSSGTTSGGMTGGTRTDADIQVTHVNNIFAYNYFYTGAEVAALRDWSITSKVYFYGQKNIVGNAKYTASEGTFNVTNPVAFFYDPTPQYDDELFASYTTNTTGQKVPVFDPLTNTIALAETGVATGKALSKATVVDPEIEALIPLTDMRGFTRSTTAPSLGSYEYNVISAISDVASNSNTFVANNLVNDLLILKNNLEINRMCILNMAGKLICSVTKPDAIISIKVPAGLYLARFETVTGVTTEKLIVKK